MVETTQQVLSERRMATLRDLGCQGSGAKTLQDAADMCSRIIVNTQDFTFAQVYLVNRTKQRVHIFSFRAFLFFFFDCFSSPFPQ